MYLLAVWTCWMDNETFSAIVEQYTDFAYNIAYRMVNNPADAEDVVQEAFLEVSSKSV